MDCTKNEIAVEKFTHQQEWNDNKKEEKEEKQKNNGNFPKTKIMLTLSIIKRKMVIEILIKCNFGFWLTRRATVLTPLCWCFGRFLYSCFASQSLIVSLLVRFYQMFPFDFSWTLVVRCDAMKCKLIECLVLKFKFVVRRSRCSQV